MDKREKKDYTNKILIIPMALTMLFSSCGTTKITAYPDSWPISYETINISGNYRNCPSPLNNTDDYPTLFTFFYYMVGFYRYDGDLGEIDETMAEEFSRKENNVQILQNESEIIISLFNDKTLIKRITTPYLHYISGGLVLKYHYIMAGEVCYGYEFEFHKTDEGALVVNNKSSMQYGWFLEYTDRNNQWFCWDRIE